MKNKLRLISLLLSLLLLASSIGCSMPGIGTDSGESTSEKASTTIPPEDITVAETTSNEGIPYETETEYLGPFTEPVPVTTPDPPLTSTDIDLPKLDYSGEPVRILYGSDAERNEFNAEESGDIVDDYAYLRNIAVEDRLNVKLEYKGVASNASHAAVYVQYADNMHAAGEPYYIYAATRRAMGQMLVNDLLLDINTVENLYIDFSKPWYPATLWDDLSIKGSNFYITGDISANTLLQMNAIFYNKRIAERFERGDIASLVMEGKWTLDAMIELSSGVYIDEDNSGSKTGNDMYGFTQSSYLNCDAFYSGSGLTFFTTDPTNDTFVLASLTDMSSAKADTLVQKLYNFFNDPSSYVGSPTTLEYDYTIPFAEDHALFCHGILALADKDGVFSKLESEYGILPIPKYDTDQEEYITTLTNKAVFWGFNRLLNPDTESMITAVTEAMAYEGYKRIAPAVFESVMKKRYALGEGEADMFDLLRASLKVDIGKLFAEETAALPSTFAKCVTSSASQWKLTIMPANFKAQVERAVKAFTKSLEHVYVFEQPLQ